MTTPIFAQPVAPQQFLYMNGGNISVASNTTLTITPGQFRDVNNAMDINVGNYLITNLTPANTTLNFAVNGINGLDTGTFAASTTYKIFAIADQDGFNPSGYIASVSAIPTLPFGYGTYRYIGDAVSDGSTHLYTLYQSGNESTRTYYYDVPPTATTLTSTGSDSYANIELNDFVPLSAGVTALIQSVITPSAAGRGVFYAPVGSSSTTFRTFLGQVTSVVLNVSCTPVPATLSTTHMYILGKVSNTSDSVVVKVDGWVSNY